MFRKVIVGVDGHSGARDAVALAKDLAAGDGKLALANVRRADRTRDRHASGALTPDEDQRATWILSAARREAGIEAALLVVGSPSVGQGLHELAELHRADLLVVGSNGLGRVGRVMLGDDTRDALNGVRCAVAVAPAGYAERTAWLGEIGVGYDGSPESEDALSVARQLATDRGARLSAFEAVSLSRDGRGTDGVHYELVDEARARIAALGDIEPHAAYGDPAEELAMYGASVDLLVVGSRGYGPLGRLVHGSTSQVLARTARCPLLVLTRGAAAQALSDSEPHDRQLERTATR